MNERSLPIGSKNYRIVFFGIAFISLVSCISKSKFNKYSQLGSQQNMQVRHNDTSAMVKSKWYPWGFRRSVEVSNDSINKIIYFYPNGKVNSVHQEKFGLDEGKQYWYFKNGQAMSEYSYNRDTLKGFRYDWDRDGNLLRKTYNGNSLEDGVSINLVDNCSTPYTFNGFCLKYQALPIDENSAIFSDSLYITGPSNIVLDSLTVINVFNTTKDTVYIYSERIDNRFLGSVLNHRLDTTSDKYQISFLPTFWKSRKFTGDFVLEYHYNWYRFTEIPPNEKAAFELTLSSKHYGVPENAVIDFCPICFGDSYDNALTTIKVEDVFEAVELEFAVYKDVRLLCCHPLTNDQYVWEVFRRKQKEFQVISFPIEGIKLR